jgi:hypothetical protein
MREQIQDWFVDRQTCIVKKQAKLFHIETSARAGGVKLLIKDQFSNPKSFNLCILHNFHIKYSCTRASRAIATNEVYA